MKWDERSDFPLRPDMTWRQGGNCFGHTEMVKAFYGETKRGGITMQSADAASFCLGNAETDFQRCPVFDRCLTHALDAPEDFGVWAATLPKQRRIMRRERRLEAS